MSETLTPFPLQSVNITQIGSSAFSLGQQLAAASLPVVLTAAQLTTLTPPAAITNYANETGGNLATINTNTAPLVASGGGGYIRQDSTATIAKESGGNLATLAGAVSSSKFQVNISQVAGGAATNAGQTGALQVGGAVATNSNVSSATYPLLVAGSDYGATPKIQNLKIDSSGNAQVAITNTPTVTANAGTNLNTSALALESGGNLATIAGAVISQETTTSGVKGVTIFGAVTTNAPSYTTGKSDALSLDPSGLLRVSLKDSPANTNKFLVTPDSVALPAHQSVNVDQIGGSTLTIGQQTAANSIPVILPSATITTLTPPAAITGFALDATLTGGTQQTKVTNGTNIADVVANDTGYNGQAINGATKTISFTTSSSGAQTLAANTDCRGYSWITIITTGIGSGLAWGGQFAPNSGGTYITCSQFTDDTSPLNGPGGLGTSNNKIYSSPILADYFQLNVTALSSGTLSGYIILSTMPRSDRWILAGLYNNGNAGNMNNAASTGDANGGAGMVSVGASKYRGDGNWDRSRIPVTFKTATATASGNTAVWTPTSGKKFRLMRYKIDVPANAAISGGGVVVDITFQDSSTDMNQGTSLFIPTTAVTTSVGGFTTGWIDLGNGILSASANNVLNINLSSTLTTSKVRVQVCGTEE